MLAFIEFLRKRPSDRVILGGRITFGLAIALLLWLNFTTFSLTLPESLRASEEYIKYGLFIFAVVPVLMGATNLCISKRKHVRIIQTVFGFVLIFSGSFLIADLVAPTVAVQSTTATGSLDYARIAQDTTAKTPIDVGFWLALLGILPLLAGVTGKCITSKCMKYGEVIQKIRV